MKRFYAFRLVTALMLSISLLFVLTACQEEYIPSNAKTYQYNYYPGTDWGMTEQEVIESLNLKEKDIQRLDKEEDSKIFFCVFHRKKDIWLSCDSGVLF